MRQRTEAHNPMVSPRPKKIWIDLDNSPHVPFFIPVIKELNKRSYQVTLTARDCFQVCGLADLFNLRYRRIGRHYGKNRIAKIIGTLVRSFQLFPIPLEERPNLALSLGSRSQLITASMLRIPIVIIIDYEHAEQLPVIKPNLVLAPEVVPDNLLGHYKNCTVRYPGIKEDVYVPDFEPDPTILDELGLRKDDILVTIRPPATEAHYHNPESEKLFAAVIEFLGKNPDVRIVVLPRNEKKQTAWVKNTWAEWCAAGKIIIPDHVVDGLNLIWHSDFVVSGGGTMNREAAALGVPVYSIFRGKIGAVDRYLSENGRLALLESVDDVTKKIRISRRKRSKKYPHANKVALNKIVDEITGLTGRI